MNKASRDKDISKIKFYGPLASALSYVVYCSNKSHTKLDSLITVYRGLKVSQTEIEQKYKIGSKIHL